MRRHCLTGENNRPGADSIRRTYGACGMTIPKEEMAVLVENYRKFIERHIHGLAQRLDFCGWRITEHLAIGWIEHMESLGLFGRGFDQPLFMGIFQVVSVRIFGRIKHT